MCPSCFGANQLGCSPQQGQGRVCVVVRLYRVGCTYSQARAGRQLEHFLFLKPLSIIAIKTLNAKMHIMLKRALSDCKMVYLFPSAMVHADLFGVVVDNVHDSLQLPRTTGTLLNISFREGFQTILKLFYSELVLSWSCDRARQGLRSPVLKQSPVPNQDTSRPPW